jgi:hypothetical protein
MGCEVENLIGFELSWPGGVEAVLLEEMTGLFGSMGPAKLDFGFQCHAESLSFRMIR